MQLQIAKWGNSLAVRLPAELAQRLGLREGDRVEANLGPDGSLSVRPLGWDRRAFAADLAQSRAALPMGSAVTDALRDDARY